MAAPNEDLTFEDYEIWEKMWMSHFAYPTLGLKYWLPDEVPALALLQMIECPLIDFSFREFYNDCASLICSSFDVEGIMKTDDGKLRIRIATFKSAVGDFLANAEVDYSLFGVLAHVEGKEGDDQEGVRFVDPDDYRRQIKKTWNCYQHIAHFMRRLYSFVLDPRLNMRIKPFVQDRKTQIPILLGAFMVYMFVHEESDYPELGPVDDFHPCESSLPVDVDRWTCRYESVNEMTRFFLAAISKEFKISITKRREDKYFDIAEYFKLFIRSAKNDFKTISAPPAAEWWWFCERGHALPYLN
ncbi:hypothetical protein F5B19DRAFT_452815 [Rostrohypoxylon terebratum]|nr:hypothetical protein F5B19DRAFT_452815 [Rostrohypoxylon terebratum]